MPTNYYTSYDHLGGSGPFSFSSIDFMENESYLSQLEVLVGNTPPNGTVVLPNIDYTIQETQQTITLTDPLAVGDYVTIRRHTDAENRIIEFSPGAQVTAKSLNKALDQIFFIVQENFNFQQVLMEFPQALIELSNPLIMDGDALIWDASQSKFKAGRPLIQFRSLVGVDVQGVQDMEVLTFSSNANEWVPLSNISFDPNRPILDFTGYVEFTGTIIVPSGATGMKAINAAQVESIVSTHATNYNTAMLARIEKLEADSRLIIARGRFWNKTSDYWCRPNAAVAQQGYTIPTFDFYKQENDWDNLKNLTMNNAYYLFMSGVTCSPQVDMSATGSSFGEGTAFFDQTQMDTFSWDFSFEDSTLVADSVNPLKPPQYHIQLTVEGLDDRVYQPGANSRYYHRNSSVAGRYWAHASHLARHTNAAQQGGGPSSQAWEYIRDPSGPIGYGGGTPPLPARAGWMDNFPWGMDAASYLPPNYDNYRMEHISADDNTITHIFEGSSWGTGHDMMQRHGGWNNQDANGDPDDEGGWTTSADDLMEKDQYRSCRGITQPLAGIKICNKSQYGFTVTYWIRRPMHFEYVTGETGEPIWHAVTPYQKVDALGMGGAPVWVSFPFPYNFNFNIIVTE